MRLASVALVLVLFAAAVAATQPEAEAEAEDTRTPDQMRADAQKKQDACDEQKAKDDLNIAIAQMSQNVDLCVYHRQENAKKDFTEKEEAFQEAKRVRNEKRAEHDGVVRTLPGKQVSLNGKFCLKVAAEKETSVAEEAAEKQKCECTFQHNCMLKTGATDCLGFGSGPFRDIASFLEANPENAGPKCGTPGKSLAGTWETDLAKAEKNIETAEAALKAAEDALTKFDDDGGALKCNRGKAEFVADMCKEPSTTGCRSACKDKNEKSCGF